MGDTLPIVCLWVRAKHLQEIELLNRADPQSQCWLIVISLQTTCFGHLPTFKDISTDGPDQVPLACVEHTFNLKVKKAKNRLMVAFESGKGMKMKLVSKKWYIPRWQKICLKSCEFAMVWNLKMSNLIFLVWMKFNSQDMKCSIELLFNLLSI